MSTFFKRCYSDGKQVRLYKHDCIEGMLSQEAGSVDVIVTSPPYNLGIAYSSYDDTISRTDYEAWTRQWAKAAHHVLSGEGSLFLNVGGKPTDPWVPLQVASWFREEFELQNVIHWIKSIAIEESIDARKSPNGAMAEIQNPPVLIRGHYKPINSPRFLNDCQEYIFHFTKTGEVPLDRLAIGVPYQDKSNVTRWRSSGSDLHCRGNTWFIPYETIQSREIDRPHPATFPVRLPEMCLRLHGRDRINTVFDPFMGLGSSAVAAVRMDLNVIGYDIDAEYLGVAVRRLEEILGPAPLPVNGGNPPAVSP